jgi:hypothetical protein
MELRDVTFHCNTHQLTTHSYLDYHDQNKLGDNIVGSIKIFDKRNTRDN